MYECGKFQTFPPMIWIFTKGDGIKSRLPFKIFSTLYVQTKLFQNPKIAPSNVDVVPKLELNHTTRSDVTVSSISK